MRTAHGLATLTWVLPVASIGLGLYIIGAIAGGLILNLPVWLLLLLGTPTLLLLWLALTVALIDVTQRPDHHLPEEAKIVWLLVLAVFNVLAFIPYYMIVIRRHQATAQTEPKAEPAT